MPRKKPLPAETSLPVVSDKSKNRPGRPKANSSKENSCLSIKMCPVYAFILNHISLKEGCSSSSVFLKAVQSYLKTQYGVDIK